MPRLYTCTLLDTIYTFRGATRSEARQILREADSEIDAEDRLVACCTLSASDLTTYVFSPGKEIDWDSALAGIVTELARHIREASGLSQESAAHFTQEAHTWLASPDGKSEMLMMGLFGYTLDTIREMDPADWYATAAAAETLYQLQNPPAPRAPSGPPAASMPNWKPHKKEIVQEGGFNWGQT